MEGTLYRELTVVRNEKIGAKYRCLDYFEIHLRMKPE